MSVSKALSNNVVAHSTVSGEDLKNLILRTLPNPNKFVFAECTNCLSCYVCRVHLSVYLMDDGFRYNATFCNTDQLKGWMLYGGYCFSLSELEGDLKVIKSRLECRGFIPVSVVLLSD